MLKINYVFREMKQADILKACCILFSDKAGQLRHLLIVKL